MSELNRRLLADTVAQLGPGGPVDPESTLRDVDLDALHDPTRGADPTMDFEGGTTSEIVLQTRGLRFTETLGRGGMGWVRLAEQPDLRREVAVKTLPPGRRSPLARSGLLREARVAGSLEHPNIVPVHALHEHAEHGPLMVMKRIEGQSWRALIRGREHALERHLEILMDVCQAAHFAHSRGVVHRDIKPDNVMVGDFGEVYLLDWGIASCPPEVAPPLRRALLGTPAYMSPEMATQQPVSSQTDVYLLGACLQEVITGSPPHGSGELLDVLERAATSAPLEHAPARPRELVEVVRRACHPDPERRFESAEELRDAVAAYLRHRGAVRATAIARKQLEELTSLLGGRETPEGEELIALHAHFSACRFGFESALADWPDNAEARAGLQEVLERMVEVELDAGHHRSAAVLLAALPAPRADLEAAKHAVRRRVEEQEQAALELGRLQREQRIFGMNWGRTAITLLGGFFAFGLLVVLGAAVRSVDGRVDPWTNLYVAVSYSVVSGVMILLFRRHLLDNTFYQQVMSSFLAVGPLLVLHRVAALALGFDFATTFAMDLLMVCAVNVTLAAAVDRVFAVSAVLAVMFTTLALSSPTYGLELVAVGYMINAVWLAWIVRPVADRIP